MSIESQLKAIANRRMNDAREVFTVSFARVANMVITESPVRDGYFRNNWNTKIGSIDYTISGKQSASGSDSIDGLNKTIPNAKLGTVAYFTNPLPYGPRLEYDGWSAQAPQGFLRVNTAKWESIVNEEVAKRR